MAHSSIGAVGVALIELAWLATSCAAAQVIPEDFVIKLERTACYGRCPVYGVSIDAKGNVTYDGTQFVRVVGRQTDRIPVSRVAALVETVDRIRFFELDDKYSQLITDLPTTFVTVTRDGRSKRIEDYFGAPQSLKDLERQIDDTARTARWIGQDQARQRLPVHPVPKPSTQSWGFSTLATSARLRCAASIHVVNFTDHTAHAPATPLNLSSCQRMLGPSAVSLAPDRQHSADDRDDPEA